MNVIERLELRRAEETTAATRIYREMVRKAATDGTLCDADQAELERVVGVLQIPVEQIGNDISALEQLRECERVAEGRIAAAATAKAAADAKQSHVDETEMIERQHAEVIRLRDETQTQLHDAEYTARRKLEDLLKATDEASTLRHDHWQLLDLPEQPREVRTTYERSGKFDEMPVHRPGPKLQIGWADIHSGRSPVVDAMNRHVAATQAAREAQTA